MVELKILSPTAMVYNDSVDACFFPGVMGEFEVLPHHGNMISALSEGDIRIRKGQEESKIHINSGIVKIENNIVTVCVEL